jgi:flagellar assembly protein FliH
MTNVIRSARLASEPKTVPVPAVYPFASAQQRPVAPISGPPLTSVASPPSALTFEDYKQRFVTELAELQEQTLDNARERGQVEGRVAVEAQSAQLLSSLREVIDSARNAREQYVEEIADEAVEIVFTAVVRILGQAFEHREAVVAAVQQAIRSSKERRRLVVRVAPRDFALINNYRGALFEGASTSELEVLADEQVKLGGCVLEGASGDLDARLETQLERLRETLLRSRAAWADGEGLDRG